MFQKASDHMDKVQDLIKENNAKNLMNKLTSEDMAKQDAEMAKMMDYYDEVETHYKELRNVCVNTVVMSRMLRKLYQNQINQSGDETDNFMFTDNLSKTPTVPAEGKEEVNDVTSNPQESETYCCKEDNKTSQ